MPLVEVTLVEGRTGDQINSLIQGMTDVVVNTLGSQKDAIRVIVREVPGTHWAAGGVTIAEKRAQQHNK